MVERRSLVEGIKPKSREELEREKEFVFGEFDKTPPATAKPSTPRVDDIAKSPISTRIRADYALAIKRASLERRLNGLWPSAINDILEEALEPWLKNEGYL
jgi:hypothetical protein